MVINFSVRNGTYQEANGSVAGALRPTGIEHVCFRPLSDLFDWICLLWLVVPACEVPAEQPKLVSLESAKEHSTLPVSAIMLS